MGSTNSRRKVERKIQEVTVLCGGTSNEREVSISSGENVKNILKSVGIKVKLVVWDGKKESLKEVTSPCVVMLHGEGGEDGKVQTYLEELGVKYTGSGPKSCEITFDKLETKKIFQKLGIKTPRTYNDNLEFPCVLKPRRGGSSIGTKICFRKDECVRNGNWIVEEYIDGREISVSVVELYSEIVVLPILEIIPTHTFYDYESKYSKRGAKLIAPAALTNQQKENIENSCKKVFSYLNMHDYARIDGIISRGEVYFLEVNAIPGMTKLSDLPASAKAGKFSMADILISAVESSLRR